MKRSMINSCIREFEEMLREYRFALPPFLYFTPAEWAEKGHEYDEIRNNALGWDITDYGEGHFEKKGLSLITLRNGNVHNDNYSKCYAEKIINSLQSVPNKNYKNLPSEQNGRYY